MDSKLYVGHIAPTTTAQDLTTLFSEAGPVVAVQLLNAGSDDEARRGAYVTMASRAAAQTAIDQFHKTDLAGSTLAVSFAPARGTADVKGGQLSAFGAAKRGGQTKPRPGQARGGYQSSLGAFGSGKSAPTPPRRRGGSLRH